MGTYTREFLNGPTVPSGFEVFGHFWEARSDGFNNSFATSTGINHLMHTCPSGSIDIVYFEQATQDPDIFMSGSAMSNADVFAFDDVQDIARLSLKINALGGGSIMLTAGDALYVQYSSASPNVFIRTRAYVDRITGQ